MDPTNELRFSLSDRIDKTEIGPLCVPLAVLGQFAGDVGEFLKGSSRDVDLMQVHIAIQEGSLVLVASSLPSAGSLWHDLDQLRQGESLDDIDPKRAAVVERWQAAARQYPNRSYIVGEKDGAAIVRIHAQTNFRKLSEDAWVAVEKYLHGRVTDLGGKTRANVHLELPGGMNVTIAASQEVLAEEEKNRLYREAVLHVMAEENLRSGELRNLRLIAFEPYEASYDETEFQRMVERGTRAWEDVNDAAAWVDELRGGKH